MKKSLKAATANAGKATSPKQHSFNENYCASFEHMLVSENSAVQELAMLGRSLIREFSTMQTGQRLSLNKARLGNAAYASAESKIFKDQSDFSSAMQTLVLDLATGINAEDMDILLTAARQRLDKAINLFHTNSTYIGQPSIQNALLSLALRTTVATESSEFIALLNIMDSLFDMANEITFNALDELPTKLEHGLITPPISAPGSPNPTIDHLAAEPAAVNIFANLGAQQIIAAYLPKDDCSADAATAYKPGPLPELGGYSSIVGSFLGYGLAL